MKENFIIVHGSFSSPYSNWFGWLANTLIEKEKSVYEKAIHALSPFILIQYTSNLHDLMHPYYIMSNGIVNGL